MPTIQYLVRGKEPVTTILTNAAPRMLMAANENNYIEFFRRCRDWPGFEFHDELADFIWWTSDVPSTIFNHAYRAILKADTANATIDMIKEICVTRKVPFKWTLGSKKKPADLGERLMANGFEKAPDPIWMAARLKYLDDTLELASGVSISPVEDEATFEAWLAILAEVFEFPETLSMAFEQVLRMLGIGNKTLRHYIAYLNGEPVGTSTLLLAGGVAGIYNVATLPDARRRGIGTALTVTPLLESRSKEIQVGVLQSSTMGKPVYEKIGFSDLSLPDYPIEEYVWTPD